MSQEPPEKSVSHNITETITIDYEKIATACAPLFDRATPAVEAWRSAEIGKAKVAENGLTYRTIVTHVSLVSVVACVSTLAYFALTGGQGAIAEKIVIGLLAFLGGFGMRR